MNSLEIYKTHTKNEIIEQINILFRSRSFKDLRGRNLLFLQGFEFYINEYDNILYVLTRNKFLPLQFRKKRKKDWDYVSFKVSSNLSKPFLSYLLSLFFK